MNPLRTTPCSPTAAPPRWSAPPAPWTGSAFRASTAPRFSDGCLGRMRASGRSGPPATTPQAGATSGPTMVLETIYNTPAGSLTVTDALMLGDGQRGHDLGADSPGTLLRQVACTEGTVDVDVVFSPAPGYGLITAAAVALRRRLSCPRGSGCHGVFHAGPVRVQRGRRACPVEPSGPGKFWASRCTTGTAGRMAPLFWTQAEITRRLADTLQGWTSWSGDAPELSWPVGRPRRRQRADPAGPELLSDRRDRAPPRRRPCRRSPEARATGTTATPGSGTPA